MEGKTRYSVAGALSALGSSLFYLLLYVAVQFGVTVVQIIGIVADLLLTYGGTEPAQVLEQLLPRILEGANSVTLISNIITAAGLLIWFRLRHKPLGEAAGLRRCSGWIVGFCAFAAIGLFVIVGLVVPLLPEPWVTSYENDMALVTDTGLIPALAMVLGAPILEELLFRGIMQSRLEQAMPVWAAVLIQAALFGVIHGIPIQIGYAFVLGLIFGWVRYRAGSILPTIAAHMVFNGLNDPLGLLDGVTNGWYLFAGMVVFCAAGCVLCRRGLGRLLSGPAPGDGKAPAA